MNARALSLRQAAAEYAIGRRTLAEAVRCGDLPASRLGRRRLLVLRRDLEDWLARNRVEPDEAASERVEAVLERRAGRP